MTKAELIRTFEAFDQKTILVIGDVMVDSYVWGEVERISPEAPVPILSSVRQENRLGGAANVVLNIKALGAHPITCAVVGRDATADIFRARMQHHQLDTSGLFVADDRPTTRKTRLLSGKQQLLRVDEETTSPLNASDEAAFVAHCTDLMDRQPIDAIIFEDYDKGAIGPMLIKSVVRRAKQLGIPTLVDPKKRNFLSYEGVSLFKPNFKELKEGLHRQIQKGNIDQLVEAANYLIEHLGQSRVLVTLSELGVFISNGQSFHHLAAQVRDIADVSGAGDTVISVASLCLACGLPDRLIAAIANLSGGLVCEKIGVVPIDKKQLLHEALRLLDA